MKPLIGITTETIRNPTMPYSPFAYGNKHGYADAVSAAGGLPVFIPIAQNTSEIVDIFTRLDGILFAGGNDLGGELYGQVSRDLGAVDVPRDTHELRLLQLALAARKPVLGICRGMQLINIARGGTLYQDIGEEVPSANKDNHDGYAIVKDPKYLAHTLSIEAGSALATILKSAEIKSNSRHHQAIKDLGEGLVVNAYADDGIIEGVEDTRDGFLVGVQCHPESIYSDVQPEWLPLFDAFITACKPILHLPNEMPTAYNPNDASLQKKGESLLEPSQSR